MLGIPIVQVEPTNHCNRDCDICMRRSQSRALGFMDLEGFKAFVDLNKPSYIGFHGWGEPLLHRGIVSMVAYASSRGSVTSLITNGTLLSEELAEELFKSGLRELVFGVYRFKMLEEVSSKIALAVGLKERLRVKRPKIVVDVTVYEDNRSEVLDLVREAANLGVEAINMHRIFNLHDPRHRALSPLEEQELFDEVKRLSRSLKFEVVLPKRHEFPCRIARYSVFVTWDFKVTPCCFLYNEVLAEGPHVKLKELAKSRAYKEFLSRGGLNPTCSRCII